MPTGSSNVIANLGRRQCLALLPHDPNLIASLKVTRDASSHRVDFVACFPTGWDFLDKRIFRALPNSVMIEAISQAAMVAFKILNVEGAPATGYITQIRNHAPFFDYYRIPLLGSFHISRMRRDRHGLVGHMQTVRLTAEDVLIMSVERAGFRIFQEKEEDQ